jgi:hypothetical protein
MLRSRVWRRVAPIALVAGFAIFTPVRAHAFPGIFESSWQRLSELFALKSLTNLFANNAIEMDPNGKPAPSGAPTVAAGPVASGSHGREPHTVRNSPR